MNFKCEHSFIDLDDLVTPLTAASYLGRLDIVKDLIEWKLIDINFSTDASGKLNEI